MSHFTVMVFGENPEEQLAPFQENNMGDCPEEFLEFHSTEEGYRKEYEEETVEVIKDLKDNYYFTWDKQFEVIEDSNDCFSKKEYIYPTGWEKVEISFKEKYKTFDEFCEDWHGSKKDKKTGKYGYWENPNKKWDWYQLGGRWTGIFKLKKLKLLTTNEIYDAFMGYTAAEIENFVKMKKETPEKFYKIIDKLNNNKNFNTDELPGSLLNQKISQIINEESKNSYPKHIVGDPGLLTNPAEEGYCDQALKKDIDFEGMKLAAADAAYKKWDEINSKIKKSENFKSWKEICNLDLEIEEKRKIYNSQKEVKAFDSLKENPFSSKIEDYFISCEKYVKDHIDSVFTTFAVLKDGIWYEKGEMGWFAMVSNENINWNEDFMKLFDSVSDDTLISIYDCHI